MSVWLFTEERGERGVACFFKGAQRDIKLKEIFFCVNILLTCVVDGKNIIGKDFFFSFGQETVSFQHSYINFSGLGEVIHDVDLYDGLLL